MSILALTSDTLIGTPATGNLEYNGQFYGTDSALSRAQMERVTLSTVQNSTSGTSITFGSIPAWVKRVTVMLNGVSTNSNGVFQVQLGTGGTAQITGYNSIGTGISSIGTVSSTANNTTGFGIANEGAAAAATRVGTFVLTNITGNTWMANIQFALSDATRINFGAGNVTLSGTLDTIRIIASATGNPADTFDAGSINILYEG